MNLQWILLAFFLASIVWEVFKALTKPMHRNILNLISIPVAFIITFILQAIGIFQSLAGKVVDMVISAEILGKYHEHVVALLSTLVGPVLFTTAYALILWAIRILHVNLIVKFIENKQMKKEKRLLRLAIQEEKELVKGIISKSEEQTIELIESLQANGYDYDIDDYLTLDEDEIEDMVEKRVKKEKKAKKKRGFFKESSEKKTVSFVVGAVSGYLAFAIAWMPFFYTMSLVSDVSAVIDQDKPQEENVAYLAIDFLHDNVAKPYRDTFVYNVYYTMGLVDLMNNTVKVGGKMVVNEKEEYADELLRSLLVNLSAATVQLMSKEPNEEDLTTALENVLIKQPIIHAILLDTVASLMEKVEVPEETGDEDFLTKIKNDVIRSYKNIEDNDVLSQDITAVIDLVVVLVKEQVVSDLLSGSMNFEDMLSNRDVLKSLIGAISGLSVYSGIMEGAFVMGVDMLAPMLGVPANDAEGYTLFVDKVVSAASSVTAITDSQMNDLETVFEEVAATELKTIFSYIEEPVNELKKIQEDAKKLADEIEALGVKIQELTDQIVPLQEKVDEGTITAEEQNLLNDLIQQYKDAIDLEETKAEEAQALADEVQPIMDEFQARATRLTGFISYFTNWMNVQKPFMLSGEDVSNAPLSLKVDGKTYVCNTDAITIDDLLDMFLGDSEEGGEAIPPEDPSNEEPIPASETPDDGGAEGGEGAEGEGESDVNKFLNMDLDSLLNELPFIGLLEKLTITEEDVLNKKASPLTDLINHLIITASNTSTTIDKEWLNTTLGDFVDISGVSNESKDLANKLINSVAENYDYKSVTVQSMKDHLYFDDEWNTNHKKDDSQKLVDVIFTIIDLMDAVKESEGTEGGEVTLSLEEIQGFAENGVENGGLDGILNMLSTLGKTFDIMADTHCLKDLPALMLEGLLKNDMLSMVMTPSMLNSYMQQITDKQFPMEDGQEEPEEFTYEKFMNKFLGTFSDLLDSLTEMEVLQND